MKRFLVAAAATERAPTEPQESESCERVHHVDLGFSPWIPRCPTWGQFEARMEAWSTDVDVVLNDSQGEVWYAGTLIYCCKVIVNGKPEPKAA